MLDSSSGSLGLQYALAILLVGIAMAGFFAIVVVFRRRFPGGAFGQGGLMGGKGMFGAVRGRRSRIQVIEAVPVDTRRRAVLIRRDNIEHLVLIGGPTDVVIESGIDAPFEPAQPEDDYVYDDEHEDAYEPEPAPPPRRAVERPAPRASQPQPPSRRPAERAPSPPPYQEWDDEEAFAEEARSYRTEAAPASEFETLRDEPPVGTIRPVTLSRMNRTVTPAQHRDDIGSSAEEAALARELEAARKRPQLPGPRGAMPTAGDPRGDFDDVLAREMEEKLEAAKRMAQSQRGGDVRREPQGQRPAASAPDPQRNMQAGLQRIFGDNAGKNSDR